MAVYFQKREVVVPGQLLAEGRYRASFGTYDDGEKIYSALVGLAELRGNTVKVVALEGVYIPREGDLVLGTITMVTGNNWKVDIGGPYLASLHANNALRRPYDEDLRGSWDHEAEVCRHKDRSRYHRVFQGDIARRSRKV